jgi:uncharacterized membrane protein YfcA
MYAIGFDAKSAVPLNLAVSLITLAFAMASRTRVVSLDALATHLPEIIGLAAGGMISAFYGARLVHLLSTRRLVQLIALLLAGLGSLLLLEGVFPFQHSELVPSSPAVHLSAGMIAGIGIGLVSSILGVAGGELLIPILIFLFGADIKTAGSASILISLLIVTIGLWRYWQMNAIPEGRGVQRITLAMSLGSIFGGLAVAYAPVEFLKIVLGGILLVTAFKTMVRH